MIYFKPHHYNELLRAVSGISKKILSDRLKKLVLLNLVQRRVSGDTPIKVVYSLTKHGKKLAELIVEILKLEKEIAPTD